MRRCAPAKEIEPMWIADKWEDYELRDCGGG